MSAARISEPIPLLRVIDHVVVATTDLDASADEFIRLGFTVTTRARHLHYGTANRLIVLDNSYIELLGVESSAPADPSTQELVAGALAQNGGIPAFAFASEDAIALHRQLVAQGIAASEPSTWSREADTPFGALRAEFTTFAMPDDLTWRFATFVCQHHTREAVWCAPWMQHANQAFSLAGISVTETEIPAHATRGWERLLGEDCVRIDGRAFGVRIGTQQIHFLESDQAGTSLMIEARAAPHRIDLASIPGLSVEFVAPASF